MCSTLVYINDIVKYIFFVFLHVVPCLKIYVYCCVYFLSITSYYETLFFQIGTLINAHRICHEVTSVTIAL